MADGKGGEFLFIVEIAELDDGKSVELVRQTAQGDFDLFQLQPVGFEIPIGSNCGSANRNCGAGIEKLSSSRQGCGRGETRF